MKLRCRLALVGLIYFQGKISVDNHTVFEIFIEHALGVVQKIYVPEGVFLRRGQLIHLHKDLLIVKSIKFLQYRQQFL